MEIPPPLIHNQLTGFADAALLGFLLAAGYDCYRAFRAGSGLRSPVVIFCIDFLFWVAATIFCLWHLFAYRWGEVFFSTYVSLAAGAAGYFILFSRFILPLWRRFFDRFFHVLGRMGRFTVSAGRVASRPFARTGTVLRQITLRIRSFLSRILL